MSGATITTSKVSVPPPGPTSRLRIDHVDGLRALAALYVMLHHAWLNGRPAPEGGEGAGVQFHWLSFGHFAVTLFIVLSGYCLMLPVVRGDGTLRGGVVRYLRRRARRILPPYYAALALSLLLAGLLIGRPTGALWDLSLPVRPSSVVSHALLLHDLMPAHYHKINYVFWSVAVEWQIYFVFPLLVFLWRRVGGGPTTLVAVVAGYVGNMAAKGTAAAGLTPHYLGMFSLGMLSAAIAHGRGGHWEGVWRRAPWGGITLGAAAGCVCFCWFCTPLESLYFRLMTKIDLLLAVAIVGLLVRLGRGDGGPVCRALGWRPLVALGGFSYSLYLMHAPLQQVLLQYVLWPLGMRGQPAFLALALVGGPAIIAACYAFHRVAERPFLVKPPSGLEASIR